MFVFFPFTLGANLDDVYMQIGKIKIFHLFVIFPSKIFFSTFMIFASPGSHQFILFSLISIVKNRTEVRIPPSVFSLRILERKFPVFNCVLMIVHDIINEILNFEEESCSGNSIFEIKFFLSFLHRNGIEKIFNFI